MNKKMQHAYFNRKSLKNEKKNAGNTSKKIIIKNLMLPNYLHVVFPAKEYFQNYFKLFLFHKRITVIRR